MLTNFVKVIEDTFKILFFFFLLRWEAISSLTSSVDNCIDVECYTGVGTDISTAAAKVCQEAKKVLFVRNFIIQGDYTQAIIKNATDLVRVRYLTIADRVNNSVWRLSLFEKLHIKYKNLKLKKHQQSKKSKKVSWYRF